LTTVALETMATAATDNPQYWANLFAPLSVGEIYANFELAPLHPRGEARSWYDFCQSNGQRIYEYPTREYVTALATYLAGRCAVAAARTGERPRLLEVAAGQGRLAFLLNSALTDMGAEADVAAVDNFSWQERDAYPTLSTPMDFRDALQAYRPHIVWGAWLPGNGAKGRLYWAQAIQAQPSVQEYILIGPEGRHAGDAAWDGSHVDAGFEEVELAHLQQYQIPYDARRVGVYPSTTITFQRNAPPANGIA
jgi:hypothetical protein